LSDEVDEALEIDEGAAQPGVVGFEAVEPCRNRAVVEGLASADVMLVARFILVALARERFLPLHKVACRLLQQRSRRGASTGCDHKKPSLQVLVEVQLKCA
jgi:hypothetical protein